MSGKQGIQLSINMFVVIILSLVLLGLGFSLFFQGVETVEELTGQVDQQTENQLKTLLDDGGLLVLPFRQQEVERGDLAVYSLGISNELGDTRNFSLEISYAGAVISGQGNPSVYEDPGCQDELCASTWIKTPEDKFVIENNDYETVAFGIELPRRGVSRGQYAFNVDVCYNATSSIPNCIPSGQGGIANRYGGSRLKVYVNVE